MAAAGNGRASAAILAELRGYVAAMDAGTMPGAAPVGVISEEADADEITYYPILGRPAFAGPGLTTLISSLPKCGKTTLLYWCVKAWLDQGLSVLYLTEDPSPIVKAVCRELGLPRSIFRTNTGRPWAEVSAWAAAQPANITVVDTVRTWVGMDPDSENDAPTVVAALTPLQRATRERAAAPMLSHHLTKAGGSHGVAHAGSLAFVGIADVAIEVYRDMHYERRRVLKSISRIPVARRRRNS